MIFSISWCALQQYLFYILGVYKKLEKIGKRKRKGFTIVGRWARSISLATCNKY
jgi:hypothetical protein